MQPKLTDNAYIEPISQQQQAEVVSLVLSYMQTASKLYSTSFAPIPILFDLRGTSSGMYQRTGRQRKIRFNPWLFAKYYQQSKEQTVPHEVAHYIADSIWGNKGIRPHGREWKSVMLALGAQPKVTANYDLTGIPVKKYQRFAYSCGCKIHQLTLIRHRRLVAGKADYRCRSCQKPLKQVSE
jgi:SprT protein